MSCGNNCPGCDCADAPAETTATPTFQQELEVLINKHSQENGSNTPDFLLARFLGLSLAAFNHTVMAREQWYGRSPATLATGAQPVDDATIQRLNVLKDRYLNSTQHTDSERSFLVAAVEDCITVLRHPETVVAATVTAPTNPSSPTST